jgi:hypothetical protein
MLPGAILFCSIQPCPNKAEGDLTEEDYYGQRQDWPICGQHLEQLESLMHVAVDDADAARIIREFVNRDNQLITKGN